MCLLTNREREFSFVFVFVFVFVCALEDKPFVHVWWQGPFANGILEGRGLSSVQFQSSLFTRL